MKEYQQKLEKVVKYWGNDLQASSGEHISTRQMDEQINRWVNRQIVRRKDRLMDGQIDERISVEVEKVFKYWGNDFKTSSGEHNSTRQIDRQMDGYVDRWVNRQIVRKKER